MKIYVIIINLISSIIFLVSCSSNNNQQKKESIVNKEKVAYLAAYMKGDDEKHLYYAIADSGFNFQVINQGKPVLSASFNDKLIRDPMILQDKDGIYHLVATVSWKNRPFTIWDSKDLVTWENERLIDVAPEGASKTWAPELAYDEKNNQYFVYWTAELNNDWNTAAIYYATTTDFINFSEPLILFKDTVGILDANIIKVNDSYKLIYRKNGIWIASSKNAIGPYSNKYQLTTENVEGPYAFHLLKNEGYGIVWDYFGRSQGFGLWTSTDFENWKRITNEKAPYYNEKVEFPNGIRHGGIIAISQEELKVLKQKL